MVVGGVPVPVRPGLMLPADLQHHLRGQPWRPTSLDPPSTAVDPVQFLGLELPPLLLITQSCGGWLLLFSSELQSYTPPDLLGHATPDSLRIFRCASKRSHAGGKE